MVVPGNPRDCFRGGTAHCNALNGLADLDLCLKRNFLGSVQSGGRHWQPTRRKKIIVCSTGEYARTNAVASARLQCNAARPNRSAWEHLHKSVLERSTLFQRSESPSNATCREVCLRRRVVCWCYCAVARHGTCRSSQRSAQELAVEPRRLALVDVGKTFGGRAVVEGVSLEVNAGEVVGLLGPNGAGKSTAFSVLAGRERPTVGRVQLGGADITALPLHRRARLGIGYLPQEPSVFRGLTVEDNIRLVLQETGHPPLRHDARLQELLEEFRLTHVGGTLGRSLSGGEQRRVELARALAANCAEGGGGPPRFLLVDEPFAGVDPIGVQEIQGVLRRLCEERGMGVLITDHNVSEALRICDRAYVMFEGRLVAGGAPAALLADECVQRVYLGTGPQSSLLPGAPAGGLS